MLFTKGSQWLRQSKVPPQGRRPKARAKSFRPRLEALEDRSLMSSSIVDLGPMSVAALNDVGQVVGTSGGHAVLWQNGIVTDLGTLGGAGSAANDLNNVGQIVGSADTPAGTRHAFLISPDDTDGDGHADRWFRDDDVNGINDLMLDLGTLGGPASDARGINNLGQVVGRSDLSAVVGSYRAFLWDSVAGMQNLGTIGGNASEAAAINDRGQIAGTAFRFVNGVPVRLSHQAFIWDAAGGGTLLGSLTSARYATGINDAGQVVGQAGQRYAYCTCPGSPNYYRATNAFLWQSGASTLLGFTNYTGPDNTGFDVSINKYAQAVGLNWLWQDGTKTDLNTLVDPALGWTISTTSDITDAGVIVGQGTHAGLVSSFLMVSEVAPPPVSISINDKQVNEGNTGTVNAVFSVSLSRPALDTVTVDFSTADGWANAGSDYRASSGSLTFAPGEISKAITIVVFGDTSDEYDEMFYVNLSNAAGASLGDAQGVGTIVGYDAPPSMSINDVSIVEGNSGVRYAEFTVTLSAASGKFVEAYFATANGTATTSNKDYTATSGVVQFSAGETTKTIRIAIRGDTRKEANETFFVNLSTAYGATLADAQGVGTILNDDGVSAMIGALETATSSTSKRRR